MEWVSYEQERWHNQPLPPARRKVLCQIAAKPDEGMPPAVAVGYLKYAAGDPHSPNFIVPGVGGPVVAWCDCLGDDYYSPLVNLEGNRGVKGLNVVESDGYGPWDHNLS